ncbi:hypothetical protein ASG01_11955 [Chryseobacterium sp. Leaf180]|uniref:hypothetical protein n=1 Tax=Chryseobacterium sp. Leaf180 TaxID=1736289 RepID=UPI0006F54112|nr:hypothetical protein [Chryseobacterium sp. Leaf180]KQR92612.1 hypothetical protein ASG01_11955 [Chryseobacterium sp. Leaf180]
MPISNLNNDHLTAAELNAIEQGIAAAETALQRLTVNLTPQDRKKYGSINEQNKLLVNKVYDYNKSQPNLSVSDIDWVEFEKDYSSRKNLEGLISRLENLLSRLRDAKVLHDYDNYQAALDDYSYTVYKAGSQAPGFQTKYNDMKQFFSRTPKPDPETPEEKPS